MPLLRVYRREVLLLSCFECAFLSTPLSLGVLILRISDIYVSYNIRERFLF